MKSINEEQLKVFRTEVLETMIKTTEKDTIGAEVMKSWYDNKARTMIVKSDKDKEKKAQFELKSHQMEDTIKYNKEFLEFVKTQL